MEKIFIGTGLAFFITFFAIPAIIKVAELKKLFDVPDERKVHILPIPSLGGLGIYAGFFIACLLTVSFYASPEFQYYSAAFCIIFFLGIKDDIIVLSALKKLIGQIAAAAVIIHLGKLEITNFYGFLGFNELPEYFGLIFTYLTFIVIINSFNLIDGIDGLAGSLGLLAAICFGIYFFLTGLLSYSILAFALGGSLVAFLIYNRPPAKIFMGDTGSLLIGLVNAILVIKFINHAGNVNSFGFISSPAIGFAILFLPLFDTLRVFGIRIFNRRSPFSPDRNHIHHLLLDRGLNHLQVTLICILSGITIISLSLALDFLGTTTLLLGICGLGIVVIGFVYFTKPKEVKMINVKKISPMGGGGIGQSKIATATKDPQFKN